MKRQIARRVSELAAWDLTPACRNFIRQGSPKNRRLKKIIRRQDRKRLDNCIKKWYTTDTERG